MKFALAAAVLALSTGAALAQGGPPGGGPGGRLLDLDANKDGSISRDEAQAARLKMFEKQDANKDGALAGDELVPDPMKEKAQRRLLMLDTNKDGRVTKEEFLSGPNPMFDRLDANKDGVIDKAEMEKARAKSSMKKVTP